MTEIEQQFATLIQMYFDGSWEWNSYMRLKEGQEFLDDAVHLLEMEAGVKINRNGL